MGTRFSKGFTIIETMLFLAVTGLLVLGILVGVGTSLNRQRYRDSVESFKNLLQEQYANLGSVHNSRENTWSCDSSANSAPGGDVIRGQSDCIIVGSYMRIDEGDITIYPVLAVATGSTSGVADITALDTRYAFRVATEGVEEDHMEWGTQIAWPKSGSGAQTPTNPRKIAIFFVRSPESGAIYTFTSDTVPDKGSINQAAFNDIIAEGATIPGQGERHLCVLSSGLFPTGDMAVHIGNYATSASAVEVQTNEYVLGKGGTTQC